MDNSFKISVLNSLDKHGIKATSFKQINSGRNSLSWEIMNNEKSFFLKRYISRPGDLRDRLFTEKNFLELLRDNNIANVPKTICFSKKYNWMILTWLNGYPINSPNSDDWESLINFMASIQKIKKNKISPNISNASESFFDIVSHAEFIRGKILYLKNKFDQANLLELSKWIEENLVRTINKYFQDKYDYLKKLSFINYPAILSQSDIGFHNCIKNNKKLYFFDFEYAGWDDQYKQFTDLIIQPENVLENYQANKLLKRFSGILDKEINFEILQEYIFIYRLKWTLIVLKQLLYKNSTKFKNDEVFFKAISYFERIDKIWLSN